MTTLQNMRGVVVALGATQQAAADAVAAVFHAVRQELAATGEAMLPGIGKLTVRHAAARMGRNPHTGEAIAIAASRRVVFKPATDLKRAVNK